MNRSKRFAAAFLTALCIHAGLFFLGSEFIIHTDRKTANSTPGSVTVTLSTGQPPAPSPQMAEKTRPLPKPDRSNSTVPHTMDIPKPEISDASAAEPVPAPEPSEKKPPAPSEEETLSPDSLDIPSPSSETLRPAKIKPLPDLSEAKHPPDTAEPVAEQMTAPKDTGQATEEWRKDTKETTRTDSAESMDSAGQKRIHRATPLYKSNPLPRYPASARRRGFEGTVTLLVQVSEKGNPIELEVDRSSGYKSLDRRALETVKDWKFEPGRINGEPTAMDVKVPVTFRLE